MRLRRTPGAEIAVLSDLHFDDERMRRAAERPWPAVEPMNACLRRNWHEAMKPATVMVCVGDVGGRRRAVGGRRRRPPCAYRPGPWQAVLGNHDFTRILERENLFGADGTSMAPRPAPTLSARMRPTCPSTSLFEIASPTPWPSPVGATATQPERHATHLRDERGGPLDRDRRSPTTVDNRPARRRALPHRSPAGPILRLALKMAATPSIT